ncbi:MULTISPECIES: acyl-CoA dehydrogenase family protein [Sphingobium]|uniref:acyl-CoA dehydrogenase family protein n=1 Tax=Sphingobium TaxID=165695 RepID=UPI00159C38D2|nr:MULTISPECIES: acyl-CoA dehydrogenase family protein [unclassified Sphingobium]
MSLLLSEDQTLLRDSAAGFVAQHSPVSRVRALRDDLVGYDKALWKTFGDMGFSGLLLPVEAGGSGLGHSEIAIIQEQIGRNLCASPFLATAVGGAMTLAAASGAAAAGWRSAIAEGSICIALAIDEDGSGDPDAVRTVAVKSGEGVRLTGRKTAVMWGGDADLLLVLARDGEGDHPRFYAVDPGAKGVTIGKARLADGGMAAHIDFDTVDLSGDARIDGQPPAQDILDACALAAAAELYGVGMTAFEMTLGYLKERKQFGATIGSFQALQHRAAHLHGELELARAALRRAQLLFDEGAEIGVAASVAKAMAGLAADLAVREGVQMHGGIGMTDEHDMGLFMKRARILNTQFGDPDYHANRCALLSGY